MEQLNVYNQGNILYLNDYLGFEVSVTSLTASRIVSVDSRFTITTYCPTPGSATGYQVQVNNANPKLSKLIDKNYVDNPNFDDSWCTLGRLDANGQFYSNGFYRFVRIINVSNIQAGFKAFFFAEKMIPSIH